MQSKVSMVVPCYNKEKWIGGMLQSVYDQYWDNIELILVNDGSTDGTRDVIAEWEPKLKARGYEVIIIDQDNQGVTGAVYNGMLRITGDYFCQIDCDDMLAREHLKIMAGYLDDNPEYDGVSCAWDTGEYKPDKNIIWNYTAENPNRLENYILFRMELAAWIYLVRTSYVKKCQVMQKFHTIPNFSQEPSLIVPLLGNNGRFKHIPKGLYLRNFEGSFYSYKIDTFAKTIKLMQEYFELITLSVKE
jgi:glycosyltransferase involved in cell wall biosynthesis